jgi:heme-degrading monooxygenase HmoA
MYMRITWGKLRPGSWDEYEATYASVVDEVGSIPGLKGRWLARDVDDPDAGFTVSLWQGIEDLQRYEASDLPRTFSPRLQAFFTDTYRTYHCEVKRHDTFD